MPLRYKFVELSVVSDDTIERAVNEWVAQGWQLEGFHFVTTERSRRPQMAFIAFVRDDDAATIDAAPPRTPPPLVRADDGGGDDDGDDEPARTR
jgi:hypothetical protein